MKDLGIFLEIEYKSNNNSLSLEEIKDIKNKIFEKIINLGISDYAEMNEGKPEMMLKKINSKI